MYLGTGKRIHNLKYKKCGKRSEVQTCKSDFVCRYFLVICGFHTLSEKSDSFHEILAAYRNGVVLIAVGKFSV